MDIILLAAGTSSRMGKQNKLLLPINNTTMLANSVLQALKYIEKKDDGSTLVIVTGYQHIKALITLKPCKEFIEKTKSKINLIIVHNINYRKGQFTSVQTGVKQLLNRDNPFFIALADMPLIKPKHYEFLESKLENFDACRVENGHPVLLANQLKSKILHARKNNKVSNILKTCKVRLVPSKDKAYTTDVDTTEELSHCNS